MKEEVVSEFLALLNQMRAHPQVISELEKIMGYYFDKEYRNPLLNYYVKMKEDKSSVREAIEFLKNQQPLPPLVLCPDLTRSAQMINEQLLEQQEIEKLSKKKVEGFYEMFPERMRSFGVYTFSLLFNFSDPSLILHHLVIDDGVPSRRNRNNLFSRHFERIGVSIIQHEKLKSSVVLTFFGDISNSYDLIDQVDQQVEWPLGACSLNKDFTINFQRNKLLVHITYVFELENGQKVQ